MVIFASFPHHFVIQLNHTIFIIIHHKFELTYIGSYIQHGSASTIKNKLINHIIYLHSPIKAIPTLKHT